MFRLSDNSKLEGNDFIIFKHGCGNDSEYTLQAPASSFGPPNPDAPKTEFTDESTEKMKEPCKNHTFYHVEVELIGDQNNTFKAEESNDSTEPRLSPFGPDFYPGVEPDIEHPEDDDENPKLLKIRKATLLEWDVTDDKEEKIWFDKPPTIVLKSNGGVNNQMMLKGFGAPERDDLKRKTTIMRKINPSDCNFQPLANQNIFLHWGIFVENFNDSVLNKLNDTDGEVIIRRSHLYNEISVHNEEGQAVYKRAGFGNRPIHLIDFHDVADSKFEFSKEKSLGQKMFLGSRVSRLLNHSVRKSLITSMEVCSCPFKRNKYINIHFKAVIESSQTALASGANTNDTDKPENATWYRVNFYDNSEEDSNDQDDKS